MTTDTTTSLPGSAGPAAQRPDGGVRTSLRILVRRDLAVKYQQSVLGYLWSLIEPLGMGAIYWFVYLRPAQTP